MTRPPPISRATPTTIAVLRGLLHELANIATALDGTVSAVRTALGPAADRGIADLASVTDRVFELHARMRSLLPEAGRDEALDPRTIAAEVAALLQWHADHPCRVTFDASDVAPVRGELYELRVQLLAACDQAAAGAGELHVRLRVANGKVEAVIDDASGPIWSAPLLSPGQPAA